MACLFPIALPDRALFYALGPQTTYLAGHPQHTGISPCFARNSAQIFAAYQTSLHQEAVFPV